MTKERETVRNHHNNSFIYEDITMKTVRIKYLQKKR